MKRIINFFFLLLSLTTSFIIVLSFFDIAHATSASKQDIGTFIKGDDYYKFGSGEISEDHTLVENLSCIFMPPGMSDACLAKEGGTIWITIRTVAIGIMVWFLVRAGWSMMVNADNESEVKKAKMSLVYILFGGIILFGLIWIMGKGLSLGLTTNLKTLTENIQNSLLLQSLAFLRAAAFFAAIIFMARAGIKVISAFEKEDKIKEGRRGVVNVILALFFIKIVDYVYYIAASRDVQSRAVDLLGKIGKVMGYVLGALLLVTVFYGGLQMIFSRGNEESWKKGMMILKTVFLVFMIVSLFLLIIFQVIKELA